MEKRGELKNKHAIYSTELGLVNREISKTIWPDMRTYCTRKISKIIILSYYLFVNNDLREQRNECVKRYMYGMTGNSKNSQGLLCRIVPEE